VNLRLRVKNPQRLEKRLVYRKDVGDLLTSLLHLDVGLRLHVRLLKPDFGVNVISFLVEVECKWILEILCSFFFILVWPDYF